MSGNVLVSTDHSLSSRCANEGCGKKLDEEDRTGNYTIDGKPVCRGCYFDAIGSFIEQNPIHHPGRRGPGGSNLGQDGK